MKKVVFTFLAFLIVSSFNFAQMKLQLPTEITGEISHTFLNHDLESNLKLELPSNVAKPGNEFMKMWLVGIMADVTFPMGDLGDAWSTAFSGHAMIGYMVARSILINLSVGYVKFTEKESVEGADVSFSWIPLLLGANYIFNPGKKFMPFIGFALGLYFISTSVSISSFGETYDESATDTEFGIAPRAGALFLISAATMISVALEYNMIFTSGSTSSALGILVGAMFAFH
jgi:outer membrane protein W